MCSAEVQERSVGDNGRGDSVLWGESGLVTKEVAVMVELEERKIS